ncbi:MULTISPECIES: HdeD family acid-resistance protein [unclassified Streptomyces]|uniref:HdeD family acid-resistance protein n=1 Tax=unclassified Streptomyces TaxID=2593676 RepID=UPI003807C733
MTTNPHQDAAGMPAGFLAALSKRGWQVLLTAGVAAIVLGVCVLAWPGETLLVIGVLFGIYLLISGVFQLAGAFGPHVPGGMRVLHFVTGALSILLGLICFRGAAQSLLLLALWIGFGWLLRGIMLVAAAVSTEGLPARGWQIFFGAITLVAGIVLIVSPFGSLAALTLVSGVWLVVLGVAEIVHAFHIRALAAHHRPGLPAAHQPAG